MHTIYRVTFITWRTSRHLKALTIFHENNKDVLSFSTQGIKTSTQYIYIYISTWMNYTLATTILCSPLKCSPNNLYAFYFVACEAWKWFSHEKYTGRHFCCWCSLPWRHQWQARVSTNEPCNIEYMRSLDQTLAYKAGMNNYMTQYTVGYNYLYVP